MTKKTYTPQVTRSMLRRVFRQARWVIFCEAIWSSIFHLSMLAGIYTAFSWFGLWPLLPKTLHVIIFAIFVLAALFFLVKIVRTSIPDENEVVSRIEQVSTVEHRPLTASLDQLANASAEQSAQNAMWAVHQERIFEQLGTLRAGLPKPMTALLDPYGLRALVVLALFVGWHVAGNDRWARLNDGVTFIHPAAALPLRLDAWVTPPRYTGRPPILLTNQTFDPADEGTINVPEGSELTIRSIHTGQTHVVYAALEDAAGNRPQTILTPIEAGTAAESGSNNADNGQSGLKQRDYKMKLGSSGKVSVQTSSETLDWIFDVVADKPPVITLVDKPEVQRSGALQIIATLRDDYGVNRAQANFVPVEETEIDPSKALYEAPNFRLSLGRGRVNDGTSKTIHSLVDHPWAGAKVQLTLHAYDEIGQEGVSTPHEMVLPSRQFRDPLARALVEQRRNLAMDATYASTLRDVIDALLVRPEHYRERYAVLISLAAIRRAVIEARDDNERLRLVVDELWDLAVALEDGDLSDARRDFKNALEALREGIENGLNDEELAQLMEEARNALRELMQALVEQAQRNENALENQPPQSDSAQNLRPQDLENMLDRIQELAETGSRDAAQQMLSQLQQMMENLQADRSQQNQQGQSSAQEMLNELGDMIRRQQELRDQTFQQQNQNESGEQGNETGQPGDRNGQQQQQGNGQGPAQGQSNGQGLQSNQQSLADQLQGLLDRLGQDGLANGSQLGDAQRSMQGAAEELGQGNLGGAGNAQSQALEQLRRGAQSLAEQMAGQGDGQGDHSVSRGDRQTDPLGRREGRAGADFGEDVEVPDEIDVQRAREILDQIRQRLGENIRPRIELDYLKRLLED